MRWLVTGARGLLGTDVAAHLCGRDGEHVAALGRDELDVRDPAAVAAALDAHRPDVVVNCAAWTAVDAAEEQTTPPTEADRDEEIAVIKVLRQRARDARRSTRT